MKRKQVIALIGSLSILLSSCSASPAYAGEAVTEDVYLSAEYEETEVMPETGAAQSDETLEESQACAMSEDPLELAAESSPEQPDESGYEEPSGSKEMTEAVEVDPESGGESEPEPTQTDDQSEDGTEGSAEGQTEAAPIPPSEEGKEDPEQETERQTDEPDGMSETESEALDEPDTEEVSEAETEEITEAGTEELMEEMTEAETEEAGDANNAYGYSGYGGSGGYYWDDSWFISPDFRFTQVDKEYALVNSRGGTFVYGRDSKKAQRVGVIPYGGVVCILKDLNGGWVYIESGDIRGFVPEDALKKGNEADALVEAIGEKALTQGDLLCEKADNEAFTYTKTTTYPVMARKVYAMSLSSTWIYEYPDQTSRFVGDVANGSLMYVLKDCQDGWVYIESGDVRGFVPENVLLLGSGAQMVVMDLGEESVPLAEELMDPEENRSVYYTLLSVKSAGNGIGSKICESASSFVGKLPYVYGGTSLSSGADCSGFTQSIFAGYGISIPRTAQEQGCNGQAVLSIEDAQPGDIVYYASGPHVGIYLGNGKVVQCSGREFNTAANPGKGPTISDVNYMPVTSIRRYLIIRDDPYADGGYRTDDTPYTQEQLELIWAVVAQEDNESYDGALAVISSAMNRTESGSWSYEGSNAYAQLTAAGQYCYSIDNYWVARLNGNVPDFVKQAVEDCLRRGIRNHNYTCFRATRGKATGADAVQIGGNWYFGT